MTFGHSCFTPVAIWPQALANPSMLSCWLLKITFKYNHVADSLQVIAHHHLLASHTIVSALCSLLFSNSLDLLPH